MVERNQEVDKWWNDHLPSYALGINIGGTRSSVVIGDIQGTIHVKREWEYLAQLGPEFMIAKILDEAGSLLRQFSMPIAGVGVAIGGPMNNRKGIIEGPPNLPGWNGIPLRDQLQETLNLPVKVEHDAAACCLAEYIWGAGRGGERVAYLTCGSGFGVGLVLGGRVYSGAGGLSIELGHVRYAYEGPEAFQKQGCFEAFCAGNSLPKLAAWLFPDRWGKNPPSGQELSSLWKTGDPMAKAVFQKHAQVVGDACALLGDLLGTDRIILGSLARYLGDLWIQWVRAQFVQEVRSPIAFTCQIVPAGLGEKLQDCSAVVVGLAKKTLWI